MWFSAITRGQDGKPRIGCGDTNHVDVDGRYSMLNQFYIAWDNLRKRDLGKVVGIACFKHVSDKQHWASVSITEVGSINSSETFKERFYE